MKATALQSSFNAGEFSPSMDGRVDFEKYTGAISRALNLVTPPQGGISLRPGTRFVTEIKSSASKAALCGFEPASGDAYMLEFGAQYLRFMKNQAPLSAVAVSTAITNGTFTSNITGWTDRSTGTTAAIAWDAGRLQLQGSEDGYAWCEQALTVGAGDFSKVHVIRFNIAGDRSGNIACQVGTASLGYDLFQAHNLGIGEHMISFTPVSSPVYFQIVNKQDADINLDDVVIYQTADRIELITPYSAAQSADLRFSQSNDVLYIFHGSKRPYKLERRSDYSWSLTKVFFLDGPWGGINPDTDLDASNLVLNPTFDGGMHNWRTFTNEGSVDYDGVQSVVFFTRQDNDPEDRSEIRQTITTGAPTALHIMHFQIVGNGKLRVEVGSTDGGTDIVASTDYIPGWYSISFTPAVSPFYISFGNDGTMQTLDVVPGMGGAFIYNTRANLLQSNGLNGTVTVTALGDFRPFASTDVDRMIRLEHPGREMGWGIITAFGTDQSVTVKVYRRFQSTVPVETWRLGSWSATTGYPRIGTFHQQRLFVGYTTTQPQTFWASQSGDFQNFQPDSWVNASPTVEANDALDYTLGAKKVSPIQWFSGTRRLVIGTETGQWVISSKGAAVTPLDLVAEPHTSVRSAFVDPIEIDDVTLFLERDKRSVDDLGYSFQTDGFKAADLNLLADHAGLSGTEQIAYQSKPYSLVFARGADGTIPCMTYKREQNVVGWTTLKIAGSTAGAAVVESIAAIPGAVKAGTQVYDSDNRDEVWAIVKRTIGGATKRYIEVFEGYFKGSNRSLFDTRAAWQTDMLSKQADAFYVDSGITYSGASTTTITGLVHLNGESVMVNGNGVVQGPFTVSSGQISGLTAVTKAHVGLSYSWQLRLLKMNYGAQTGTSVGQEKAIGTMAFVLMDAAKFDYGVETTGEKGSDAQFYAATQHMPSNGALFSGEAKYDMTGGGWDTDPRLIIKGSQPLPWTLLGVAPKVTTSER